MLLWLIVMGWWDSVLRISCILLKSDFVFKESSRMNKACSIFCICVNLMCLIKLLLEPDFVSPLFQISSLFFICFVFSFQIQVISIVNSSHLLKFLNLASISVNIAIYTSKASFTKTSLSFSSLWYRFVLVYLLFSSTSYFPYNCLAIRGGKFLLKSQGDDSGWGQLSFLPKGGNFYLPPITLLLCKKYGQKQVIFVVGDTEIYTT